MLLYFHFIHKYRTSSKNNKVIYTEFLFLSIVIVRLYIEIVEPYKFILFFYLLIRHIIHPDLMYRYYRLKYVAQQGTF